MVSYISYNGGAGADHNIRILRDATVIFDPGHSFGDWVLYYELNSIFIADTPEAGAHTYYLQHYTTVGGGAENRSLLLLEVKR
jgi:hypothetical protein